MTIESRLKRAEQLVSSAGPPHEPGSVNFGVWIVAYGDLCDLYDKHGLVEMFREVGGDLSPLLGKPIPSGADEKLRWLIETQNKTYINLPDEMILEAGRQILEARELAGAKS